MNINTFSWWLLGWGGLPTGWPGAKRLCDVCGTQGTETLSSGHPACRIGDQGDREIVYVPNVYVPFLAPRMRHFLNQPQNSIISAPKCALHGLPPPDTDTDLDLPDLVICTNAYSYIPLVLKGRMIYRTHGTYAEWQGAEKMLISSVSG